ncbi:hypothetical protein BCV70DRAFT_150592, partial [Testicularia cyperi]
KRNWGGPFKDWYLMKVTHNYFCTDTGRVIPVDPATGHMLLQGLRKRMFDEFFGLTHDTEKGVCKNPTWVLPLNWTQPIPITQFEAQYPWMTVDDHGQMHFKADFLAWLQQKNAAAAVPAYPGAPGTAAGAGAPGVNGVSVTIPTPVVYNTGLGTSTDASGNPLVAGAPA